MHTATTADADWTRDAPSGRDLRTDALVAIALLAGTLVSLWLYARTGLFKHPAPIWECLIWAAALNLPLALRRRYPLIIALVTSAGLVVGQLLVVPELLFYNIAVFLAFYSVGAWSRYRLRAMLVRAFIIAAMFIYLLSTLVLNVGHSTTLSTAGSFSPYLAMGLIQIITNLLYFGAAYAFGEASYRSARARAALQARTDELSAERERTATQAVALERLRIARELHDVVAHHVSVIGVQAGAARRVLQSDPDTAAAALGSIEQSSRSAVDELHLLLSALRNDDTVDAPSTSTSTRGLAQLPALVDEARQGGLPVHLIIIGDPRPATPTVELSAYRVAQEALTNARKHGGSSATAELRLRYLEDGLEIEVSDTGSGLSGRAAASGRGSGNGLGHGLGQVGMRERVAAVGGSIELGPKPRGGYLVRATFPLDATRPGVERSTVEPEVRS